MVERDSWCSMCAFWSKKFGNSRNPSSSSLEKKLLEDEESLVRSETCPTKPGWKAMPYILGNETVERLATFGMTANFMVYLMKEYNMDQVLASNILNTWLGVCNIIPIFGAFLADSYFGKFKTIALASFASLLGMLIVTLTAWVPQFHPSPCSFDQQQLGVCMGHTNFQLTVLLMGLFWLAIGTGGIRPCSVPFAIDQFDLTTSQGRRGTTKFYNFYYTTQTIIMLFNQTLLVYIQDSVSWALGFALPTLFMFSAILFFFSGSNIYAYVEPKGSIFSGLAQVLVAAKHKHHLQEDSHRVFYGPDSANGGDLKLPLTMQFRCLNKGALMEENDLKDDGSIRDPWRLCSVQQIEEFKCLIKIVPIWVASIISYLPIGQLAIFPISQALKMDRHLWGSFEVHPGSITVIQLLTIALFLPLYDAFISPALARITKQEQGLTTLQRIGLGHVFAVLTLAVSGVVERERRVRAISHGSPDGVAAMSVMWLAPQFILLGFVQVFTIVGHTEFYNKECPESMRSIGNSLLCLTVSGASYLSSFIVNVVHNYTGRQGHPDWLNNDINKGRLENYYFILAALGILNLSYFLFCARRYTYKTTVKALA
ncbi:protein NRT1/ PTR FAMILY 2.13-like [Senna tora]|uniref:Protein NRT1/ PTR FAMILY 2.13-like n=1 Tax=Senna tora TaxID=362788 RepID=A0A834SRJ6_9FABA|nr:protein NRT1/ PTR FAMILY 2.13-like [Senna tora]